MASHAASALQLTKSRQVFKRGLSLSHGLLIAINNRFNDVAQAKVVEKCAGATVANVREGACVTTNHSTAQHAKFGEKRQQPCGKRMRKGQGLRE